MSRRSEILGGLLCVLAACGTIGPASTSPQDTPPGEPGWVTIAASDPRLHYTGRVELSAASAVFSYPGVSIKARFRGDAVELLLKDHGAGGESSTNYYQVTLDNQPPVKLAVRASQTVYGLGRNLPMGEHTFELIKLTESSVGRSELLGFRIRGQLLDGPERGALKLELIGDSITCGYGNEASIAEMDNPTSGFHSIHENITRSYGVLTARNLGAEVMTVCASGRGISRNNTGDMTATLPRIYDRVLPDQATPRWSFARYTPDVVVLNLGTNDFAQGVPDAAGFRAAYHGFVAQLRAHYPLAKIICAVGPMMSDGYPQGQNQWSTIQSWVSSLVNGFNDQGDSRVYYLAFDRQSGPYGEDWHPSAATHEAMAARLTEFIRVLRRGE